MATARVLLVVDDEPEIRGLIAVVAARAIPGVEVVMAGDATEAERVLAERDVGALLTDLRMPGRSGLDLLRTPAACVPGLRRALMTGFQEDVIDGVPLSSLGLSAVLRKPFTTADLRATLRALTS